jgi:hypothetical protein
MVNFIVEPNMNDGVFGGDWGRFNDVEMMFVFELGKFRFDDFDYLLVGFGFG